MLFQTEIFTKLQLVSFHNLCTYLHFKIYSYQTFQRKCLTMKAWMKTPTILWRHITNIASGHSSLVVRDPYPIVCWVSTEKRKHPVKELTLLRQGTNGSEGFSGGLRSPWVKMISHQMSAKRSQERMKERANTSSVQRHCTSTRVVKMSWRYRRLRLATFHWTTLQSPCLKMTRLRTRLAAYRALRYLQDGKFYFRHLVNNAMCGRSLCSDTVVFEFHARLYL